MTGKILYLKRILIAVVFGLISVLASFGLCSCSKPEYAIEMVFKDMDRNNITIGMNEEIDPVYMGLDTYCPHMFCPTFRVFDKNTNRTEFELSADSCYPQKSWEFNYIINRQYRIIDKDNNVQNVNFYNSLFDNYRTQKSGYLSLQPVAGMHEITFDIPPMEDYGLSAVSFTVNFIIEEDIREDSVEICIKPSDAYQKFTNDLDFDRETYDIYLCKTGPIFGYKFRDSSDDLMYYDNLIVSYRKLDEDYYIYEVHEVINSHGVYLCQVYYRGTEKYRAINYYCYIVC